MTEWKTEKLSNLLAVSIGGIWGEEAGLAEVDVSVVRVTELKAHGRIDPSSAVTRSVTLKQLASRELQEGDLLLEKSGGGPNSPVGRVGYFFQEGTRTVCSNFMQLMRPDISKVLPKYLFYFLDGFHSNGGTIPMQTATTNIRNIKTPQYMDIDVPVPCIDEQLKILELLEDHLSRLEVALADVKQAKLKAAQFRRSLLKAAFTGNLDSEGFGYKAEPSNKWSSLPIGELCGPIEKVDPVSLRRDVFMYVDIGALEPSSSSLENVIQIPTVNAPGRARQLIHHGDSIFATVRPYMKKVAYIPKEFDGEIASTGFCVLRPIEEKLHSKFLFYFLLSDQLLDQVLPLQRGVSYPAIRDNDLKNAFIPVPPIDEQQKIVEILEDHLSRLDASVSLADAMEKQSNGLRRSLFNAAFTGQLTKEVVSV